MVLVGAKGEHEADDSDEYRDCGEQLWLPPPATVLEPNDKSRGVSTAVRLVGDEDGGDDRNGFSGASFE